MNQSLISNVYHAYAKVNVFLKITGKRENYHTLVSRFVKIKHLYDSMWFKEGYSSSFTIEGNFNCPIESNTIYKAYQALLDTTQSKELKKFMLQHIICVEKRIPSFAGLGGGSSDAATFLNMCNEICNLNLSKNDLAHIGSKIGADVPFFIYNYDSANVSGIGEIVEEFFEITPNIEIFTPNLEISTPKVYQYYRDHLYNPIEDATITQLKAIPSQTILKTWAPEDANDLYPAALKCYPELVSKPNWFFSGSGSSFFKLKDS